MSKYIRIDVPRGKTAPRELPAGVISLYWGEQHRGQSWDINNSNPNYRCEFYEVEDTFSHSAVKGEGNKTWADTEIETIQKEIGGAKYAVPLGEAQDAQAELLNNPKAAEYAAADLVTYKMDYPNEMEQVLILLTKIAHRTELC